MSENDCELEASTSTEITAEIRDGQLQIVEVSPYDREDDSDNTSHTKYMQVLDSDGKGLMQLDLLNLTLVKCEDGEDGYRLVANAETSDNVDQYITSDSTVTCVLQSEEDDDQDAAESYVVMEEDQSDQDSYVMVEGEQGPIVILQSELKLAEMNKKPLLESKPPPTALQLLEKAKAVKKAKALLDSSLSVKKGPGRKRTIQVPSAAQVLTSPNFKLYLYSCRMCQFRCNAVKELTEHKLAEHSASAKYKYRKTQLNRMQTARQLLQCARCPYRGFTREQLLMHVSSKHIEIEETPLKITNAALDSEVLLLEQSDENEILFCDACGHASVDKDSFEAHRQTAHQLT